MKNLLCTVAGLLLFVSLGLAQSVSGQWELTIVSPQGENKSKADLKQDGENVTGTLTGQAGSLPIKGTIKGGDVKLMFTIKFQDNDLPITLSGKMNGDAIKGDADFGGFAQGDWSAKKASGGSAPAASSTSSAPSSGAAIAGDWDVVFSTPNGDVNAKLMVKQDGETLSGMVKGQPPVGDVPLKGTAKGTDFEIKYTIKYDGNDLPVTMKGKMSGTEIKGSADYGGLAEGEFKGKKGN